MHRDTSGRKKNRHNLFLSFRILSCYDRRMDEIDIPKNERVTTIHLRVNAALLSQIDAYRAKLDARAPGAKIGQLQAIRSLIALGLKEALRTR
jgi:hypothetical protein